MLVSYFPNPNERRRRAKHFPEHFRDLEQELQIVTRFGPVGATPLVDEIVTSLDVDDDFSCV
jgi:hypothetical protein